MEHYANHAGGYMAADKRKAIAQELRATHFKLGGTGPSYTSNYG